VQWHSGHGTGVVYTGVAVAPVDAGQPLSSEHTPVRVTAVERFDSAAPSLPLFDGRPVSSDAIGTVCAVASSRLRPLTLATVAHSVWESSGGDLTCPLTDTVTYATFAAAALAGTVSFPDAVFEDVNALLTPEQAADVRAWMTA
jgi:hypothetical protein